MIQSQSFRSRGKIRGLVESFPIASELARPSASSRRNEFSPKIFAARSERRWPALHKSIIAQPTAQPPPQQVVG